MAKEQLVSAPAAVHLDDARLVEQARSGDVAAFSRLVTTYQDRVVNACWRISGNLDDAQELAQEAFLHAWESLGSFKGTAGFYTWLFRIAVNLAISHRRKTARAVKLSLHGPDGQWTADHQAAALVGRRSSEPVDPPARVSDRETQRRVLEGLDELDDDHRAVIVLKDIESLDYQAIADILDVPVGTVKSRLHRARLALRDKLRPLVCPD